MFFHRPRAITTREVPTSDLQSQLNAAHAEAARLRANLSAACRERDAALAKVSELEALLTDATAPSRPPKRARAE